jgi:transcriptional regulator with XRE-family HTH domain
LQHLTGLNRGYLSRLERGHIRESGRDRLLKVAGALDVSVEAITNEETK